MNWLNPSAALSVTVFSSMTVKTYFLCSHNITPCCRHTSGVLNIDTQIIDQLSDKTNIEFMYFAIFLNEVYLTTFGRSMIM